MLGGVGSDVILETLKEQLGKSLDDHMRFLNHFLFVYHLNVREELAKHFYVLLIIAATLSFNL